MEHGPDLSPAGGFGEADQPKRRRRTSLWQSIPAGVKIAAAVCLVSLAVLIFVNRNRTPAEPELKTVVRPKITAGEAFDKVLSGAPKQLDLVVTGAAFNHTTNRIEGSVSNTSGRPYANVEVIFFTSLGDLTMGTTTVVRLARLEPHENARFTTEPVDHRTKEWAVKSIGGTPR